VSFRNQADSSNQVGLKAREMLDDRFDFEGEIQIANLFSHARASAREMVQAGKFAYGFAGPIATSIIIADHSQSRSFDLGPEATRPLRPIFHATFWPSINKAFVRVIGELANTETVGELWLDGLTLTSGRAKHPVYKGGRFVLPIASRWTKTFWLGGEPASIQIDHNLQYLAATKMAPNYEATKEFATYLINSDHGYSLIAATATARIARDPKGEAAWEWIYKHDFLPAQGTFRDNPKWAILPRRG